MTQPTRCQLMTASLAAVGAAGAPAIANSADTADPLAVLDDALDGLPEWLKLMVHLNRIRTYPIERKQEFLAMLRSGDLGEGVVEACEAMIMRPSTTAG